MSQNLISGAIAAEDLTKINEAIDLLNEKMPFLSAMQNVDVSRFFKPGNNYQPLLNLAVYAVEQHPEILPAVFNREEFRKDSELYAAIAPVAMRISMLHTGLQKTQIAVGSDTLKGALEVYAAIKQHKNKVPGLSALYEEMRVFFRRNKIKTGTPGRNEAPSNNP